MAAILLQEPGVSSRWFHSQQALWYRNLCQVRAGMDSHWSVSPGASVECLSAKIRSTSLLNVYKPPPCSKASLHRVDGDHKTSTCPLYRPPAVVGLFLKRERGSPTPSWTYDDVRSINMGTLGTRWNISPAWLVVTVTEALWETGEPLACETPLRAWTMKV